MDIDYYANRNFWVKRCIFYTPSSRLLYRLCIKMYLYWNLRQQLSLESDSTYWSKLANRIKSLKKEIKTLLKEITMPKNTFTDIVRSAYGLTHKQWADLPHKAKQERMIDYLVGVVEVHEARMKCTTGPGAAFRAEFGHMAAVRQPREEDTFSTGIVRPHRKRIEQGL